VSESRCSRSKPFLIAGIVLAGLLPWVVVLYDGGGYAVNALGWLDVGSWHAVSLPTYYVTYARGSLPRSLSAWPVASLLWVAALGSVALADRRVTAGLLVLGGVDVFWFALGLGGQQGITAFPIGSIVLFVAALGTWWLAVTGR